MIINTNTMALTAMLNLNKAQSALGTAIERLSSGKRINSAKDDPAGLTIANRFTSNILGLSQARKNTYDGISIIQTTEGALDEINNNLQRIREISVQAANGSNSQSDLDSIQAEIDQRLAEIDRISSQTQFNGIKTLNSDTKLKLQVGANDGDIIELDLYKANVESLGLKDYNVNGGKKGGMTNPTIGVTPVEVFKSQLPAVSGIPGITGVSITGIGGEDFGLTSGSLGVNSNTLFEAEGKYYIQMNTPFRAGAVPSDIAAIEAAGLEFDTDYYIPVDPTTGVDNGGILTFDFDGQSFSLVDFAIDVSGSMTPDTVLPTSLISTVDSAISKIDMMRGNLGAMHNRLESVINTTSVTIVNLSAARSRIEDADYALEVSNMIRAQILQQAAIAALAQANQVPNMVLSLLKNM